MSAPANLVYNKSHEWALLEGNAATVGITDFAQHSLGDITYVELPAVGDILTAGVNFGSVESVKAASDLYSPVSGTVTAVNSALESTPELINSSPYDQGWLLKVSLSSSPSLLSPEAYDQACAAEGH